MTTVQPVYKSGTRSTALAQRLLAASTQPSAHVLRETIQDESIGRSIRGATITEDTVLCGLYLRVGEHVWFIESTKFAGRYYIVTQDWRCSASDGRTQGMCIALVRGALRVQKAA